MTNELKRCAPAVTSGNDFHEVWLDSIASGTAPKGKLQVQIHEVWLWMDDFDGWKRPGDLELLTSEQAYSDGWRYVRPIVLLDEEMRMDGVPPTI